MKNHASFGAVLTKEEILDYMSHRRIVVEPILEPIKQINHVSIDLRIDNYFAEFRTAKIPHIDPAVIRNEYQQFIDFVELEFFSDVYYLQPKRFVLAQTFEYVSLPNNVVGHLDGRSTVAREGLTVHAAAGLVDPGFKGHLVFELLNAGEMPIKLYPLMRVAKICFYRCNETEPYGEKEEEEYDIQVRIHPPKSDSDVEKIRLYRKMLEQAVPR